MPDSELVDLGGRGRRGRGQPRSRPRAARADPGRRRPSRRSPSWPIRREARRGDGRAAAATSFDGSARSPTRRSSCSARWTSASCSTRPASCSRSASGSGTARWIPSYYDLLASEARLTSFLAIAKGDVAPEHWFRLGRALTPVGRGSALISWSGSMFEYLMPALVMRAPARSLLDHTYRLVVARQMRYAAELGVPWGISESAFNARDLEQTYQYSSFGVPGLGLEARAERGPRHRAVCDRPGGDDRPEAAVTELRPACGRRSGADAYGFREALDYTPAATPGGRVGRGRQSYMAHHQGMALVALGNVLNGQRDGGALPRRSDRRGDRAAAAGARCRGTSWSRGRVPKR